MNRHYYRQTGVYEESVTMMRRKRFHRLVVTGFCLGILPWAWAQTPAEPAAVERTDTKRLPVRAANKMTPRKVTRTTQAPPATVTSDEHPLVELRITCDGKPLGNIVLELHPERTRATVDNFLKYVDEGFYDGTIFHRVLPDFIIQGGGYTSPTQLKTEGLHTPIRNESRRAPKDERGLQNARGTIAMARKRDPHSAIAQFFINVADNDQLDYPRAGIYGYCVFGHVVEGMDVVDKIKDAATKISPEAQARYERYQAEGQEVKQAEKSQPLKPAMIQSARRLDRAEFERRHGGKVEETAKPGPVEEAQPVDEAGEPEEEEPESEGDLPEPEEEEPLPEDEPESAPDPGE